MLAWRRAQEAARAAEAARLRAEAEAAARLEQEARVAALRDAAKGADDPDVKSALRQQASALAKTPTLAPPVVVAPTVPAVKGVRVTTTWRAEVVDFGALVRAVAVGNVPLDALQPNQSWLTAHARSMRQAFAVAGCRAVATEGVSPTGRG